MKQFLEVKLIEYRTSNFSNKEFKSWVKESDVWMALYSCLRIRGIDMDKKELVELLGGKLVENLPIDVYNFVHNFKNLNNEMQACLVMQESLNEKMLNRFRKILFDEEGYRQDNTIIYKWGYIAPHFTEISRDLGELFRKAVYEGDVLTRAVLIHNGINALYPFGEDSPVMALVCMYYVLMQAGIPLPSLTVDDEDYNKLMKELFDKGEENFTDMLERSLMNRIDHVMLIGKESMEGQ